MSLLVYLNPFAEKLLSCSVNDIAQTADLMMYIFKQLVFTRVCVYSDYNLEALCVQQVCFLSYKIC